MTRSLDILMLPHRLASVLSSMRVVHVTEQGSTLHVEGELIRLERDGVLQTVVRLPLLQRLVLHGAVHLTAGALARLLASDCDVVFLTADGRYRGRLERYPSTVGELRERQAAAVADARRRLRFARMIVWNKVHGQWRVMRALRLEIPTAWLHAARQLRTCTSIAELSGMEGWATRAYFRVLRTRLVGVSEGWTRRRRPPPDPCNALLSYVYALLQSRVHEATLVVGLDPYLGFLHATGRGRPALVLDLMEEFRPLLGDWLVVRLLRELGPPGEWSVEEGDGVRLRPEARRRVTKAFEERLERRTKYVSSGRALPWAQVVERQAEALARAVRRGGETVRPVYPAVGRR